MAESFADLLKRHRVAAGLSQETLAERSGVSVDAISYLERGVRHAPQKATLDLLVAALQLDDGSSRRIESAAKVARGRGPQTHRHAQIRNMPRTLTPLVGRAGDVNAVLDLVERYSLVTITGSGGVGKTRVALEVGERYAERKSSEVAFVDLSPVADGSLVVDAITNVLDAPQDSNVSKADALVRYLRNKTLLLIVDNCEHLLDAVATVVGAILHGCRSVVLLLTSRERLDIAGEAVFRLPSLAFPRDERAALEKAGAYSAIELFAERAKAADLRFSLTRENADRVADICRRLDGIPLAIELAAARLSVLGLATLQTRVSERFVLTGAGRGVPSRQATMQATIDWSYGLLDEAQRTLLNRLGVFAGGCTLEAAECVCADDQLNVNEIASLLASLVDKSLVNASFDTEPIRYNLLESVRAYAREQLDVTQTLEVVSRRHAQWLARKSDEWRRTGSVSSLLALELGNIRAALQWALSSSDEADVVTAGRVAGGLRVLWLGTGRLAEYRFWSDSLVNRIDEQRYPEIVAALLAGFVQSANNPQSIAMAVERAIPLFERIGDFSSVVHLHGELLESLANRGRFEEADKVASEALGICETHDLEQSYACVHILGALAAAAIVRKRPGEARAWIERASKVLPSQDRHWRPYLIGLLGSVEFLEGNTERALEMGQEALRQYATDTPAGRARAGIRSYLSSFHLLLNHLDEAASIARDVIAETREFYGDCMLVLAVVAALRGDAVAAAKILGFWDGWYAITEIKPYPMSQTMNELLITALRKRLSEDVITRLRAEGREMTWDQAADEALRTTEVPVT